VTRSDFPSGLMWVPQSVPKFAQPRRLRRRRLYFPHYDPPAIGARLLRERWARAGPKHGKSHMPAMISRIIAAEFSF
jgi:hypothetical protein